MVAIFYFDRSTGSALPSALRILKLNVEHQGDHFSHNTPDDQWLAMVGGKGWFVVTHDQKFHKPGFEAELAAVKTFKIGCFYLWGANATRWQKMQCFAKAYNRMTQIATQKVRPFIYKVDKNSRVREVFVKEKNA